MLAKNADSSKRVALVTGANKGIGFEIARGLAKTGAIVLLGARDTKLGEAAGGKLRSEGLDVRPVLLDVTRPETIAALAQAIADEFGRLDILVNNAAINHESVAGLVPTTTSMDVVRRTYETNVFGPIALIQALLPLLRDAPAARIVNVSSELGSLDLASDPAWQNYPYVTLAYGTSKSALNAVTLAFAKVLADTPIKVNCVCPGLTATDLSGNYGTRTPAQGAAIAIEMALIGPDGPNGKFHNDKGVLPW